MSELAEMNSKIQEVHQELGKLDAEIDRLSSAEQINEEDVELIANETGK